MRREGPGRLLLPALAVSGVFCCGLLASGTAASSSKVNAPEAKGGGGAPSSAASLSPPPPAAPEGIVFGVTVDRKEVSVGDPVTVTYSARIPAGSSLSLDALVTPEPPEGERPAGGAVLEFLPPKPPVVEPWDGKEGVSLWRQTITFLPFLPGAVTVPGPHLTLEERQADGAPGPRRELRPPGVTLQVASRLPKDAKPDALAPKDDRPVRLPAPSLLFWAGLSLLALLLGAAIWWWVARRRRSRGTGTPAAEEVPPGAELLVELARLARAAEQLGDDPRTFYADLTHALKRYLERRIAEPVLEWTTFETVRRLREREIEFPHEIGLSELLSSADLVKFGKGRSTRLEARGHLLRARLLHDSLEARFAPPRDAAGGESAS